MSTRRERLEEARAFLERWPPLKASTKTGRLAPPVTKTGRPSTGAEQRNATLRKQQLAAWGGLLFLVGLLYPLVMLLFPVGFVLSTEGVLLSIVMLLLFLVGLGLLLAAAALPA
ncbi:MAG: hypothetical protein NTU94_13785 [Planctomycetota bacterium]|nr:hypothetical protein [Planctomycetota bacterium]